MYISQFELHQFRAIHDSRVHLIHPDAPDSDQVGLNNVNVLVGTNGTGKTTILTALASAVLSSLVDVEYLADRANLSSAPQRGADGDAFTGAVLALHPIDQLNQADEATPAVIAGTDVVDMVAQRLTIPRSPTEPIAVTNQAAAAEPHPGGYFLAGYGHNRRVDDGAGTDTGGTPSATRLARVASLFDQEATLVPLEGWLPAASARHRGDVIDAIAGLLPADVELLSDGTDGPLRYGQRGIAVERGALSDGLQAFLGWLCDLLFRLSTVVPDEISLFEPPGVVLIDELDQRMHPDWQRKLLPRLSLMFPRLQFICSTHNPLVAASVTSHNLILVEEDHDFDELGATRAHHIDEDSLGLSADQMLSSSYFGLETTRSVQFMDEQRELIEQAASVVVERSHEGAIEAMNHLAFGGRQPFRRRRQ